MYQPRLMTLGTAVLALLIAASSASTQPTVTRPAPSTTQGAAPTRIDEALLGEVRLIRETLQRAQASSQRERMVVDRMRLHDERVERLGGQLVELRDEIGGISIHIAQMDEREAALELQIQQAQDPNQRRALDAERKEARFTQDAQTQRLHRLKDRESAILTQLQKEERSLSNLEARLDALDREIEAEVRRNGPSQLRGR